MSQFDYQLSYRRNLPHIQPGGTTFFVTFRLNGSIPQSVITQWNREQEWLAHLAKKNTNYYEEIKPEFERSWFKKFELILDGATTGPVWLSDERVARIIAESLHYRHGKVYRLDGFTVMSNHVHMIVSPLPIDAVASRKSSTEMHSNLQPDEIAYHSLARIMQSLKGYTAFKANEILGRHGEFWAHESYDHWIRDDNEWQRIMAYVLNNPLKAGYVERWQDWKWNYRRV
ncbi:MAG TPA: transposase [Pyrinomonadaceae bacterium]|jgi:REP element-mobilizing transposase RayT